MKGVKGCENEILPLTSVICIWVGELTDENPNEFGFEKRNENWKPKLQCDDDPFYTNPKTMLGGCGCKTKCSEKGNRCSCQRNPDRGNKCSCSAFTCKHCKCFKRQKESSEEDLINQYQDLMDQLSDTDGSEYGDESVASLSENEQEFDDFDHLDQI